MHQNKLDRLVRIKEVVERTALSRSTIYRLIDRGEFPPLRKIGRRNVAFLESDIAHFLETLTVVRGEGS